MSDLVRLPGGQLATVLRWGGNEQIALVKPYGEWLDEPPESEFMYPDGPPRPPPTDEERCLWGVGWVEVAELEFVQPDEPFVL